MTETTKDNKRVLSGTWEEVASHAPEFAGKRVTLTVEPAEEPETNALSLAETLKPLLQEAETLMREAPVPHTDPHEIAFGEILEEKKRQGRL